MKLFRLPCLAVCLLVTLLAAPLSAAEATAKQAKTVRLLNVGNSFSGNATRHLSNIVAAAGHKLVHKQASIGGGSLEQHLEKARKNEANDKDPLGRYNSKLSLKEYLALEDWDVITIQQASIKSHDVTTYRPFARELHDYIKQREPNARIVMHQTWAYRRDDPRFAVANPKPGEPKTQEEMYRQLTNSYATIAAELGIPLIRVGDAFFRADTDPEWGFKPDTAFDTKSAQRPALPNQLHSLHVGWRWNSPTNSKSALTMDGHHANIAGEYLGACVFFEFLYQESVVGNTFAPPGLDPKHVAFLQQTAHQVAAEKRAAVLQPVKAIASAAPAAVDNQAYDLVVVGGTPGGVAAAVRGAREGLKVLLVERTWHVGGMLVNGLCQWDALSDVRRAPIFAEYVRSMDDFYRTTYGENSPQFRLARFTQAHYPLSRFEPSVAERLMNRLIEAETNITVLTGFIPFDIQRKGGSLARLIFSPYFGGPLVGVEGKVFVDATYEADLAALLQVSYRMGRESREEFGEPHAGVVFTTIDNKPAPDDAVKGRLNIRPYGMRQGKIDPESPHTGDRSVQAYNYRFCITNDPKNRRLPAKPANYNREEFLHYERKSMGGVGPNGKTTFNSAILPGENHQYPEGDWPVREKIAARHKEFALGLMYFLQNDESVPADQRAKFREWGLPLDEYVDNDNIPYEMYVRETRRIVGRAVYSEHDGSLMAGIARTPIHPDSIAITDWYMDSHACTTNTRPGFKYDGKLILTEESRPGQIPYRCMVARLINNLLVPVCLSATHIAWGSVRLEPVFMQTGEAAGFAAALAIKQNVTPDRLKGDDLVRALADRGAMISFFNDVDVTSGHAWVPAVQYFATKGFFSSYDAKAEKPLNEATAQQWAKTFAALRAGTVSPGEEAAALHKLNQDEGSGVSVAGFEKLLALGEGELTKENRGTPLTRGEACRLLYELLKR